MHLPSYEKDNMNPFVTFGEVYALGKASAGEIATEIETNGIYGWDRFERFRHFDKDSDEVKKVLDALAYGVKHNHEIETGDYKDSWPDCAYGQESGPNVVDLFGWSEMDLPKFAKVVEPAFNKTRATKHANMEAMLAAAYIKASGYDIFAHGAIAEAERLLDEIGQSAGRERVTAAIGRIRNFMPK